MLVSLDSGRPSTAAGSVARPVFEASPKPAAPEPERAAAAAQAAPTRHALEQAVDTLNKFTEIAAQDVRFSIDDESGKTIVKVVDVATQTVLRQIPNAEALSLSHSLNKMQGLLVRDKA